VNKQTQFVGCLLLYVRKFIHC